MTDEIKCPKCGQPMAKNGRIRIGKKIKQKWACKRLSGCGYEVAKEIEQEEK